MKEISDLQETELHALQELVKQRKAELDQSLFTQFAPVMEHVRAFINRHKCLVYGGTGLNELLPAKHRFYKASELPDYDAFHPRAKDLAIELARYFYCQLGHKYVYVQNGMHEGTYKVFVDFMPVLDLTQVSKALYARMLKMSTEDYAKMQVSFIPAPLAAFQASQHFELAKPTPSSLDRWTSKVYPRMILFKEHVVRPIYRSRGLPPAEMPGAAMSDGVFQECAAACILFAQQQRLPMGGNYGLLRTLGFAEAATHMIHPALGFIDLLSMRIETTAEQLTTALQRQLHTVDVQRQAAVKRGQIEWHMVSEKGLDLNPLSPFIEVVLVRGGKRYLLARIFDISAECISVVQKGDEGKFMSVDAILRYVYGSLLLSNDAGFQKAVLEAATLLDAYAQTLRIQARVSIECDGYEHRLVSVKRQKWEKKEKAMVFVAEEGTCSRK